MTRDDIGLVPNFLTMGRVKVSRVVKSLPRLYHKSALCRDSRGAAGASHGRIQLEDDLST